VGEGGEGAMISQAGRDYGETLWAPTAATAGRARMTHYARWLSAERGVRLAAARPDGTGIDGTGPDGVSPDGVSPESGYDGLWQWSVADPGRFWASIWDYFDVLGRRGDGPPLSGGPMPDVTWFAGATVNYARNALRHAQSDPGATAVIYSSDTDRAGRLTYAELAAQVARVRAGLRDLGVGRGDRVAGYLPNAPEALIGLLATASLGAIWTACSPDFGAHSVIDRFAQTAPRVLIAVDGYAYGGKRFDRRAEVAAIAAALPGLEALVTVDYLGAGRPAAAVRGIGWDDLAAAGPAGPPEFEALEFEEVPFDHPLWVLYSSGTTGLPKPIMHGHGGIVLEHL
jgi:acetoacetyl-CoA synthetase